MSRNYLEAFAILIIAFALGFFLLLPKCQSLRDLQGQVQIKAGELKEREEYYAGLKAIMDDLNYYRENLEKIGSALPVGADAAAMMDFAKNAAMNSGLAVKGIEYSGAGAGADNAADPTSPETSLKNYTISLKLSGSYGNFKSFLAIIENSSRLITVESLGVASKSEIKSGGESPEEESVPLPPAGEKILDYDVKLSTNYY
ncbi:MAG: type 4a pilus biogenesis protein PilO [Minisyncoccales bacterium]